MSALANTTLQAMTLLQHAEEGSFLFPAIASGLNSDLSLFEARITIAIFKAAILSIVDSCELTVLTGNR